MSILVNGVWVAVIWRPSDLTGPDSDGHVGRLQPIRAAVHHRVVGSLESMDTTFAPTDDDVLREGERRVSSHFGIGYRGDTLQIMQYVALENTAYCNGQSASDITALLGSRPWSVYTAARKANGGRHISANEFTYSIEHEDNGSAGRYVVKDPIIEASIALDRLLLSGDGPAIRAAGIHCNDTAAEQLGAIVPGPDTIVDHNVCSPVSKPYCWRPIGDDKGFPQARYLAALGGTQEEDVTLIDFTLASDEQGGTIKVKEGGASVVTIDGGDRPSLSAGMVRPTLGPTFLGIRGDLKHYVVFVGTNEIGFVPETQVEFTPYAPAGPTAEEIAAIELAARRAEYDRVKAGAKTLLSLPARP